MSDQRRPAMKHAASAGALIRNLLRQKGMEGKLREYRAWQIWDEVVGPQIAARARPVRIREGVLEVRVDQPVWMQQLQLLKPKILGRLNERLEGAVIKDLYLRRGKVEAEAGSAPGKAPPLRRPAPALSAEEEIRVEKALEEIRDPDLKRQMGRLLTRQLQLEKTRQEKAKD